MIPVRLGYKPVSIIARVGEGVVSTIGSSESHKKVLENPDLISKRVLEKGLDAGTAFEILSIDIADVDVGENIGAISSELTQPRFNLAIRRPKNSVSHSRKVHSSESDMARRSSSLVSER